MGVFNYTSTTLYGADGSTLATGLTPGISFANAWNTIKVPYDKGIEAKTMFIAPISTKAFQASPSSQWYRFTGIRQWNAPFTGYDAV